jgi:hypothetical protein
MRKQRFAVATDEEMDPLNGLSIETKAKLASTKLLQLKVEAYKAA